MSKVCLVAHDAAPSRCFNGLQIALTLGISGVQVVKYVSDGMPPTVSIAELRAEISSSDFVLLGMSSTPDSAEVEVRAGEIAREMHVPYGFYSDVLFGIERARSGAWFNHLARGATLVVGLFSRDTARDIFPNARAVQTGNPLREDMSFPFSTRSWVRSKLGIGDEKLLIHIPGGTFCGGNIATIMLVLDACALTLPVDSVCVMFTPHPGDQTLRAVDAGTGVELNLYQEIADDAPVEMRVIRKDFLTSSQVVVGADLVVEYTGSVSIEAAYNRIPVISPTFVVWARKFEQESFRTMTEMVESGAAYQVYPDAYEYGRVLQNLLNPQHEARVKLIAAQEHAYPRARERGATMQAIVNALRGVL